MKDPDDNDVVIRPEMVTHLTAAPFPNQGTIVHFVSGKTHMVAERIDRLTLKLMEGES